MTPEAKASTAPETPGRYISCPANNGQIVGVRATALAASAPAFTLGPVDSQNLTVALRESPLFHWILLSLLLLFLPDRFRHDLPETFFLIFPLGSWKFGHELQPGPGILSGHLVFKKSLNLLLGDRPARLGDNAGAGLLPQRSSGMATTLT